MGGPLVDLLAAGRRDDDVGCGGTSGTSSSSAGVKTVAIGVPLVYGGLLTAGAAGRDGVEVISGC